MAYWPVWQILSPTTGTRAMLRGTHQISVALCLCILPSQLSVPSNLCRPLPLHSAIAAVCPFH